MKDLNENASQIKDKASQTYNTAKEKISESYNETKAKADNLVDQISNTASDLYESGKDKLSYAEECMEESFDKMILSVKQNPLTSLLIAAGVGYLFAKLKK